MACSDPAGITPAQRSTRPGYMEPDAAAPPPPPPTRQASAPGLCGTWTTAPVDLGVVGPPLASSRLIVHGDARGGFTVADWDGNGTWTVAALTSAGVRDGAPLVVNTMGTGDAGPTSTPDASGADASRADAGGADADGGGAPIDTSGWDLADAVATPGGWVVSRFDEVGALGDGALVTLDAAGNVLAMAPTPHSGNGATLDGESGGTVLVTGGGGQAAWYRPGDAAIDFVFSQGDSMSAWSDGIFYAFDDLTLHSASPDGTARSIPSTSAPFVPYVYPSQVPMQLVPGVGGTSAAFLVGAALAPPTSEEIVFVSAAALDATFTFDEEVDKVAGAPRDASGGAVLAWTTDGLTAAGGVAYGFTEVSPSGARGEVYSLGNEVIVASTVLLARSGDGRAYLTVAQNVHDREAFLLTCTD
jgi:hypothetical protein